MRGKVIVYEKQLNVVGMVYWGGEEMMKGGLNM